MAGYDGALLNWPLGALTVEQAAILHFSHGVDRLEEEVAALHAALGQEGPSAKAVSGRR